MTPESGMNEFRHPEPVNHEPRLIDQLELLAAVLDEFSTSLDIDTTLARATSLIKDYLDAEGVSIFLLEPDQRELICRACSSDADITGMRVIAGRGVIGRALREGCPQRVASTDEDPDFYPGVDRDSGAVTRALACAPMQIHGEPIGAIEVINKRSGDGLFGERDCELLSILSSATGFAIQNSRMAAKLVDRERMQRELELARDIQRGFFPPDNVGPHGIAGINLPARTVSGDFYDYYERGDGSLMFCIGDVAGKGINASLMVAHISALFRYLRGYKHGPAQVLSAINAELADAATGGLFTTMIAGLHDPRSGRLTLANAGHQPPLLLTVDGQARQFTQASPPLGIMPELQPVEYRVAPFTGSLYLYTDGLAECPAAGGRAADTGGASRLITTHAALPLEQRLQAIADSATRGQDREQLHDDITLLVLEAPSE